MLSRADKIFIALIGAGLLSIYIGAVSMYLWLGLMLVRLFFLNRVELGLFSLMFGSSLFGRLFASDILVVALTTGFLILGFILLRKEILQTIVHNKISWIVFTALLFYFVVMYLLGPMNSYATGKISRLVVRGITWLLMFQIYVQSRDVNNNHFAILLGLLAIFYLSQAYQLYNIRPAGLFDVSFFRDIATSRETRELENIWANTHTLGYLATGAMLFVVMSNKIQINSYWLILFIIILLYTAVVSGARQTMITYPFLIAIRITIKDAHFIKNAIIAFLCLTVVLIVIALSGSSAVEKSLSGNSVSESLNRDIQTPFKIISISPMFGVGFGGYHEHSKHTYPHNILLEIIAEFGAIGSFFILNILTISILASKISIRYTTANNSFFILILILFFLKSFVSGDLSSNIVIFSIINSFIHLGQH